MRITSTDEARFADLYRSLAAPILAYAARRTASAEDAADVMAETFVVAWRRIGEIPHGDDARPWLFGVARRVLANQRRGEQRRHRLSERLRADVSDAVAAAWGTSDMIGPEAVHEDPPHRVVDPAVRTALASLTETDRELLLLLAWDDLSPAEAATVLGCTRAALRVRLHRARTRFRIALEAYGDQAAVADGAPMTESRKGGATRCAVIEETP